MSPPRLSVVVEWDNVRYYEVVRARTMLERLSVQIAELAELRDAVEVELLYDDLEIDGATTRRTVDAVFPGAGLPIRVTPTRGLKYYQLKNDGGRRARGEILLFVDSDVLPERGWLRHLLRSFDDPAVEVVEGNSYIEPTTLYGKAFALGWYFPPRAADGPPYASTNTMVNNIAMRRHVFEKYPFPDESALYIAQCIEWARTLRQHGIVTYVNPSARVAHPPPRFLRSALVNGHDTARRAPAPGVGTLGSLRRFYWALRGYLGEAFRGVRERRREVGLSAPAVPLALAIVGAYWTLWAVAELATRWSPGLLSRTWLR